jgi:hypothetical protein
LGILAVPALAQDCPELVGHWPYGPAGSVAISGSYAYVTSGAGLKVVDIADPETPRVVGEVGLQPTFTQSIAVSGGYVYVPDSEAGLRIVDVSDPTAPVEVGFLDTQGRAVGVAVEGEYAYVADWFMGLRVVSIATPSQPVEVGSVDTPGNAGGVAVAGGYAYVADDTGGLRVIDISTPSAPFEVGSVDTPGNAYYIALAGDYAYVADYGAGLRVINISDPANPVEVGSLDTPGAAWCVAVVEGYAYVADDTEGLRVVDISTPSQPAEVGFFDTPGNAYSVAVAGGYAYVADWEHGLRVIDVSTPSAPVDAGVVVTPGGSDGLAVEGSYAYIGFYPTGFRVVNIADPTAPVDVGFVDTPDYAYDLASAGSYAYVAAYNAGLRVIDVSTPSTPVETGHLDTPDPAMGVAVSGGYAYVAVNSPGLLVVDISNPSEPVQVGSFDPPGPAWEVTVSGHYAYVANAGLGLRVVDVSTPSDPIEVGWIRSTGSTYDVAVSGRYAYLANGLGGLRIIDVSTPETPVEVGSWDSEGPALAWGVAVSHGYAYLSEADPAGTGSFLRVIDVGTPSAPVEVGAFTAFWAENPVVSAGHVFLTGGPLGMYVFAECGAGPVPDGRECFVPAAAVAAGAQGAFFQTDLELNNTGADEAEVHLQWLPRGQDNSEPVESDSITLPAGHSLRYENVLASAFGLSPDSVGALKITATTESIIGMSRTYNIPGAKAAGTFGQGLPAIRATDMIQGTEPRHLIFFSENDESRANVGCVNGSADPVVISLDLFDDEGSPLETKTMELGPYSNNQINRVFRDYQPVNGSVEVRADSDDALYFCYGSMLDNLTSDPTTILPQLPSHETTFIPAAALAAGLEGAFFETDIDLANVGSTNLTYELLWLPRGADNSDPVTSDTFSLAAGSGVRYANVLDEVFGLEPDAVGALAIEASGIDLLAMSRTYNLPSAKVAGTFGQELPGIPADRMIASGVKKRIIFMNENDDVRSNVGCANGSAETVRVFIELFNAEGESLETRTMDLAPYSNNQITRVFRNYSPVEAGYVDVWTNTEGASIYCYGSVLDNSTSDPTTVLPQ